MANVFDVADFFIQIANQSEDDQITNLKLNKLLYYAQGVYLARTGKPLFDNHILAWPLGPVVSEVYHKYKVCGRNPIPYTEEIERSCFSSEEFETILDVIREFGQYTGNALVSLTHKAGTPWDKAFSAGHGVLEQTDIRDYFIAHPVPKFETRIKTPIVNALPQEWYDPDEDSVWEAYL